MYSLPTRPYWRCGHCENNNNNNKVDLCTSNQLNKIRSLGYFYFILAFTKACHFNPYFWTVPCHCHWWTQATTSSLAGFCSTLLTTHYFSYRSSQSPFLLKSTSKGNANQNFSFTQQITFQLPLALRKTSNCLTCPTKQPLILLKLFNALPKLSQLSQLHKMNALPSNPSPN